MVLSRDAKHYVSRIEIMTTRFSDYGFSENKEWREDKGMKGCIYGTPKMVSSKVEEGVTRCFFINSIWYLSKHVLFSTSRRYSARQHEES